MLNWIAQYNKALAALTMAIVFYLNNYYGVEIPLNEMDAQMLWGLISAFIVFLVPNKEIK